MIHQLEEQGFCTIRDVFDSETVTKALESLSKCYGETETMLSRNIPFLNRNQPMVYNLQSKDLLFLRMLFGPSEIESILIHFLNDKWYKQIPQEQPNYILRSYIGRSSAGAMPLHIDSFIPYLGDYVYSIQFAIVLQDQHEQNGCTVVVPGSHKSGIYAEQSALSKAVPIESRAGDVVMWDSRLWHGTTANTTGNTRWAMIATFGRWWLKQAFNIPANLPVPIANQLSLKEKSVLGFCSLPFDNEFEGIDMKRGYEDIEHKVARVSA